MSFLRRSYRKQRRSINRLQKQTRRYHHIFEAIPNALVILKNNHNIVWFNEAAMRLLGIRHSDIGLPIEHFLRSPDFVDFLADPKEPVILKSPVDSAFTLNIQLFKLSKRQTLLMAEDISHAQRLDQMRRDFVANVSHELRTPLTVIHGYLEAMSDSAPDDGQRLYAWREALMLMGQQSQRMGHIIDDLLLLSQLDNHQLTYDEHLVDILPLVENLYDSLLPLAESKNIELRLIKAVTNCDCLYGSERELFSAFYNLITNAIRYTPENGVVILNCQLDYETGLIFSVEDNGIGIEADHIPRLTERFFRVDVGRSRELGGTGLGLAIVKHVLNRHSAELKIRSQPGKGSCFSCHFSADRLINLCEEDGLEAFPLAELNDP